MPFRFAPVALDVKFSAKQAFLCRCCSSSKPVFFANLKAVKKGS